MIFKQCVSLCHFLFLFSRTHFLPGFFFFCGLLGIKCPIDVTTQLHYKHHTHNIRLLGKLSKGKQTYAKQKKILPIVSLLSLNYFLLYQIQILRWWNDQNATMTKSVWHVPCYWLQWGTVWQRNSNSNKSITNVHVFLDLFMLFGRNIQQMKF